MVMHEPQPAAGRVFAGRFEIDRPAGSGGMGTVYRARDLHTGAWVALKLLHEGSTGPDEAGRFAREARLLAELRHPGIVAHVAHGQSPGGRCFLAMEWLEGEDLAARLARGPLPIGDSLVLLRRTAEALAAAHHHGVIHRDIKPSEIAAGSARR
jgi:serine/threonine protein kinase